jgi:Glycosyl transferases group 1
MATAFRPTRWARAWSCTAAKGTTSPTVPFHRAAAARAAGQSGSARRRGCGQQKSLREGFGLTVSEAMWKGRAVIGGDVGGTRHQIVNKQSGFLVGDLQEAANHIRRTPNSRRNRCCATCHSSRHADPHRLLDGLRLEQALELQARRTGVWWPRCGSPAPATGGRSFEQQIAVDTGQCRHRDIE